MKYKAGLLPWSCETHPNDWSKYIKGRTFSPLEVSKSDLFRVVEVVGRYFEVSHRWRKFSCEFNGMHEWECNPMALVNRLFMELWNCAVMSKSNVSLFVIWSFSREKTNYLDSRCSIAQF